jgi:hypothetical protein
MIELKEEHEQKSFQRLDVAELERLMKAADMQNHHSPLETVINKLKEFFVRH